MHNSQKLKKKPILEESNKYFNPALYRNQSINQSISEQTHPNQGKQSGW